MASEHTDDLRNVREGDRVKLETSTGETIKADCVSRLTQHSDPEAINITETNIWEFQSHGVDGVVTIYANITDGLSGTGGESPFPMHNELWNATAEENLGYITDLTIYGDMEE